MFIDSSTHRMPCISSAKSQHSRTLFLHPSNLLHLLRVLYHLTGFGAVLITSGTYVLPVLHTCLTERPLEHLYNTLWQGETSPLPPVEALRKLRQLLIDGEERGNSGGKNQPTHVCRTLLRANILMPLAGIISADGRRTHARRSSAHFPVRRFSGSAQVCRDYKKSHPATVIVVVTLRLQLTVQCKAKPKELRSSSHFSLVVNNLDSAVHALHLSFGWTSSRVRLAFCLLVYTW